MKQAVITGVNGRIIISKTNETKNETSETNDLNYPIVNSLDEVIESYPNQGSAASLFIY